MSAASWGTLHTIADSYASCAQLEEKRADERYVAQMRTQLGGAQVQLLEQETRAMRAQASTQLSSAHQLERQLQEVTQRRPAHIHQQPHVHSAHT